MANWVLASHHSRGAFAILGDLTQDEIQQLHRGVIGWKNIPLSATARRSFAFKDSIAFVTGMKIPALIIRLGPWCSSVCETIRNRWRREHQVRAGRLYDETRVCVRRRRKIIESIWSAEISWATELSKYPRLLPHKALKYARQFLIATSWAFMEMSLQRERPFRRRSIVG